MTVTPTTCEVLLTHAPGLHARPCLAIVKLANQFRSAMQIVHGRRTADARNILELLSLGAPAGSRLQLSANGADAAEALEAMADLFGRNFGMDGDT